jgi:hypothetical protein
MTLPANITIIETLADYIGTELPELSILEEFPNHNDQLTYPALSIITVGDVGYRPYSSKELLDSSVDPDNPSTNDINVYAIGHYDLNIQLDIWASNKEQRAEYYEKVMNVLDKQLIDDDMPSGLSLPLKDYYNIIARYDHTGYNYVDGEDSANRTEWRAKIKILGNFVRGLSKSEPRINEAGIVHEVASGHDLEIVNDNIRETKQSF